MPITVDAGQAAAAAAELLRTARRRHGLSQRELAAAAGVSQPMIARFESGRSQPTLPTLARLLAAAGFAPVVDLVNIDRPGPVLAQHADQVRALARDHKITRVRVFGSVARGEDGPGSDVDLLVDFAPGATLFDQARFQQRVEDLLGVEVDVVSAGAIRRPGDRARVAAARDL